MSTNFLTIAQANTKLNASIPGNTNSFVTKAQLVNYGNADMAGLGGYADNQFVIDDHILAGSAWRKKILYIWSNNDNVTITVNDVYLGAESDIAPFYIQAGDSIIIDSQYPELYNEGFTETEIEFATNNLPTYWSGGEIRSSGIYNTFYHNTRKGVYNSHIFQVGFDNLNEYTTIRFRTTIF